MQRLGKVCKYLQITINRAFNDVDQNEVKFTKEKFIINE